MIVRAQVYRRPDLREFVARFLGLDQCLFQPVTVVLTQLLCSDTTDGRQMERRVAAMAIDSSCRHPPFMSGEAHDCAIQFEALPWKTPYISRRSL